MRVEPRARRTLAVVGVLGCLLSGCAPRSAPPAASPASSAAPHDWRDATYRVTCDGLLLGTIQARLVDGAAHVPVDVSQSAEYQDVDLRLEATATGDVDGDGAPDTVVLLQCSPQPSNGFVEEVHVVRSDGAELGVLPSPQTLPETTILAPLYVPSGLTVQDGDVVAAMKAYGPDDSHATGPSVPFTVRWHWTGTGFVRVSPPRAVAPSR
jgi:hypothetical protein